MRRLGIDPALLEDKRTGFHATLFRDDNGRYVLSYEGTDFRDLNGDVRNDAMGAGFTSEQVHQAIEAALLKNGLLSAFARSHIGIAYRLDFMEWVFA